MPRGWFSGPGIGVLDARYLMLDCSNDPLTAGLEINAATAGEPVLILQTTDDDPTNLLLECQNAAGTVLSGVQARGTLICNLNTDPSNLFVGPNTGNATMTGTRNVYIGNDCGQNTTTGYENIALGEGALRAVTTSLRNVAMGRQALTALIGGGGQNFALGYRSLYRCTTGSGNTSIGVEALSSVLTTGNNTAVGSGSLLSCIGNFNIGIGGLSGQRVQASNYNVYIGYQAGRGVAATSTYSYAVMIGAFAGLGLTTGANNTIIGYQGGQSLTTGASNLLLGHQAGLNLIAQSNRLFLANTGTDTPLIYGEFDTWRLAFGNQYAVDKYGQLTHASGYFAAVGDSQDSGFVCRLAQASHAVNTWYPLFPDGGTTPERLTIAAETGWTVIAHIIGITAGAAQQWGYEIIGLLERDGAGNTTLAGQTPRTIFESDANYDAQLAADDANEALEVQVRRTGGVDYDVRWTASVKLIEVTYPS